MNSFESNSAKQTEILTRKCAKREIYQYHDRFLAHCFLDTAKINFSEPTYNHGITSWNWECHFSLITDLWNSDWSCGLGIKKKKKKVRSESLPKYEPIKTPFNERFMKLQQFCTTLTSDIDWCSQLLTTFCDLDRVVTPAFFRLCFVLFFSIREEIACMTVFLLDFFLQIHYTNCLGVKVNRFCTGSFCFLSW